MNLTEKEREAYEAEQAELARLILQSTGRRL